MRKIYRYECRRLLWNRFFAGLVLILLFYGWQVLNRVTILGVSHMAPFSAWSFGDYLCRMLPFLWIGTLLFLTFFTSKKARRVSVLTDAAPADPRRYAFVRCAAVLTGTGILALCCLGEAALFYGMYFGWYGWTDLAVPALITLVPPLIFALGSGWLLGRIRNWLLYLLMFLPFICRALPLPQALWLWSGCFFEKYAGTFESLDPGFSMPAPVMAAQGILLAAGIALASCRCRGR